jgi:outer membrane protein assembly factor BamB
MASMSRKWVWCVPLLWSAACGAAVDPATLTAKPYDWPQWQGPARTAISKETGLLKTWPEGGPRLVWKAKGLGGGYSTPSVAGGRIFGMSFRGKDEVVWALAEVNGTELWKTRIAEAKPAAGGEGREGSRSTPTVDGDVLYALGEQGDLVCLETATGKEHWHKNLVSDFGGGVPTWGYSESPLVDGDKLIVTPGGKTATLVALNKTTGEPIWKAQVPEGDQAQYSSVIIAQINGQRQYVQFLKGGVVGVSASDGAFLWRYNHPANGTANCSTPIFHNQCVFAASGYGAGGGLAKLVAEEGKIKPEEVYFCKQMKNQHGGMVLVDGYLYGADDPSMLTCLEFKTGKVKWEERKAGKGSIAYADGRLYYRDEQGPILLAEANPEKYVEHGRFNQPDRSHSSAWAHPVIANGRLYISDQDILLCYEVKEP